MNMRHFNIMVKLISVKISIALIILSQTGESYKCQTSNCSCEGLAYIPMFPVNTTNVKIINPTFSVLNHLTVLNLTAIHLKELTFIGCEFSNASTCVFSRLTHLRVLKFLICKMPNNVLIEIFLSISSVNVTSLLFDGVNKKQWSFKFLNGMPNSNVSVFRVIRTTIKIYNGSELESLKSLRTLDLTYNKIAKVISWGKHYHLKGLFMYGNPLVCIPHFMDENKYAFFPRLTTLRLSLYHWNFLAEGAFKGLGEVRSLNLYIPNLFLIKPNTLENLKQLVTFSLTSKSSNVVRLGENVFATKTLRFLTLRNMTLDFPKSRLNDIFIGIQHICFLKLQAVSIKQNISLNDILRVLTNLEYLEISRNILKSIPKSICDMKRLHTLILSKTGIRTWKTKNCSVMNNLSRLSLSYNKIFNVNESSFSNTLLSNKKLKWDLSHNKFVCNCRILWFRDWMKEHSTQFMYYPKSYLCNSPSHLQYLQIAKYCVSWEYCKNIKMSSPIAVSGVVLGTFSVIFIIMGIVSYVKRWSIRYWIYFIFSRRKRYKVVENITEHNYDAFVCYCGSDIRWVTTYLLPILEEENHLHICLHDRDFVVGNDIIDNIVDSIQQSRKVVLVLSSSFAQSQWCQFETSLAQQRLFEEKKDTVIPILLEEIPTALQTTRLSLLLKRKTYLEWSKEDYGQKLFWERLLQILHEDYYCDEI